MPPADGRDLPDYLDEIHQDIAEFYGRHSDILDEDFVDGMLEARGYQRESRWALPDPGGPGGGQQRRRPGPRQQQPPKRSGSYFGGAKRPPA